MAVKFYELFVHKIAETDNMLANIKNIFCPVNVRNDETENLCLPLALARSCGAKLIFCYAAKRDSSSAFAPNANKNDIKNFVARAQKMFAHETNKFLPEQEIIVCETTGDIAEKIADVAQNSEADLIILCANSRSHRKFPRLSSVAEKVLHHAPCSVLIAGQNCDSFSFNRAAPLFRRILAAHDFSDYSEIALQYAFKLAEKFNARLDLLHVIDQLSSDDASFAWAHETVESMYYQTVNRLQIAAKPESEHNLKKAGSLARWGKPYREILNYAEKNAIDLIAMGERGADFGAKSLSGSNADRVWRQAECAVLIARPISRVCPETARKFPQKAA